MVHQLKLQNVTNYNDYGVDTDSTGYKYYAITAQNQDTGTTRELHLSNSHYLYDARNVGGDEIEAGRTFDCNFNRIDEDARSKDTDSSERIFRIEGLKIDGAVEYDAESHTFTVPVDENQQIAMPACYINQLNAIMNDHYLDLSL